MSTTLDIMTITENLAHTQIRRPRITQFKSESDFWDFHEEHPEAFDHMDFTAVAEMAKKVRERSQSREADGSKTPSKNGKEREETGANRSDDPPPCRRGGAGGGEETQNDGYRVGPGNPPKEHQFKPGNPGGPGGPIGPRSMRKLIRTALFDEESKDGFAVAVTAALFQQAMKGNTHAIRIIVENGNNRPKRRHPSPQAGRG